MSLKKIKVMFINAIDPYTEIEYRYPQLGLGYLASSLQANFGKDAFDIKIVDRDIRRELEEFKPDIAGVTSVTQNYGLAAEYARLARSAGAAVIAGGIHISLMPSSITNDMDVAVLGEGERTIVDLLELFLKRTYLPAEELGKVRGIAYRNNLGKLIITEKQLPINPMDDIPRPDRDLLKINKHSYLFSSRGCPYSCVFCASTRLWDKVRFFSAQYVAGEIRELIEKYNVDLISFYDDLMIADVKRLKELVFLLKKDNIPGKKVRFAVNARADLLTEEVVRLLKDMNTVSVGMGLESGNARVLRYLKGEGIGPVDNQSAVNRLKKYGIAANASFVIGSPDETRDEIRQTFGFIKSSGISFFDTYVATPFPGTPLWDEALKRGLVNEEMDWSRLNVNFAKSHKRAVIVSGVLTREGLYAEFRRFQRLRLVIAARNLAGHPFLFDILSSLVKELAAKLKKRFHRAG